MRIIAGKWKGRTIAAPDTMDTRPILDRAKVVLFDMLGHRLALPGVLPPIAVLDLFAGSGALGLEALSRGARYCTFVEQARPIAAVVRQNLDALHIIDEGIVVQADAAQWEFKAPPPPKEPSTDADAPEEVSRQYELVFVDPPYRLLTGANPDKRLLPLFDKLAYDQAIARNAFIIVRHSSEDGPGPDLSPLIEHERREVGTMWLRFMVRPGSDY